MKAHMKSSRMWNAWLPLLLISLTAFILTACAAGNYGYLDPSMEAQKSFESYQILPGYKYYYSGADADPSAIVAIKEGYTIKSDLWTKMAENPETLEDKIEYMTHRWGWSPRSSGAAIIGPDGNEIGIWYSTNRTTTVKLNGNELAITPPHETRRRGNFLNILGIGSDDD